MDYSDPRVALGVVARVSIPLLLSGNDPLPQDANSCLTSHQSAFEIWLLVRKTEILLKDVIYKISLILIYVSYEIFRTSS